MKFGLCILGCGGFAKTFAKSIQPLLPNVELYFASRNLNKAQLYCREFNGTKAFGAYSDAVKSPYIDGVYVCTPHHLHLDHTTLAATEGKHVLVEKPISNNVQSANEMITIAETNNVKLMVAENYRFIPTIRLCRTLVTQGAIGDIRMIQVQQESPYRPSDWRSDNLKNGGGVLVDAGIHKIHFLRYMLGEPDQIYATTPDSVVSENKTEDGIVFVAKWTSGPVGLIYHSWTASQKPQPHWISVSGTKGKIYFEIRKPELQLDQGASYRALKITEPLNGILSMVEEFISSIQENRLPEVTGSEGLQDLIMVQKAYESIDQTESLALNN